MSGEWVDGPRLVEWLRSHGLRAMDGQVGSHARRIRDWERGAIASVYTVDAVLVKLGRHLSEIPEEFYCEEPDRTPRPSHRYKTYSAKFKAAVVRRALSGESYRSLAAEFDCSHATVGNWVRRMGDDAGIEREAFPVVDGGYR